MLGRDPTFLTSLYRYFFESDDKIDEPFELIDRDKVEDTIWIQIDGPSTPLVFSETKQKSKDHQGNYAKLGIAERRAIERLNSRAWLRDLEIHDYLSYAASRNSAKIISVLHPGYFSAGNFNDSFLKEITNPNGARYRQREQLLNADLILCPIVSNNHWYLLAISKSDQANKMNIRCLDGFNRIENHMEFLLAGKQLVERLHGPDTFEYDLRSAEVVRQNNGFDCGTVISFYGTLLCDCPNLFETNDNLEIGSPYFEFRKIMIDGLNEAAVERKHSFKSPASCSAQIVPPLAESLFSRTPTPTPRAY